MKTLTTGWILALAGVTVIAATAGGTAFADPQPSPLTNISQELRTKMAAQDPLKAAANRIRWSVERNDATGYAGIGLDSGEVIVWWKGTPPAAVAGTLAEVRSSVPVRVVSAAHSRAELTAAAEGVSNYLRANPGSPYHSVDIASDGRGLTVKADPLRPLLSTLPAGMRLPAGIPVSVKAEQRPQFTARLDDTAPYWGGGRIQNNENDGFCTAGFAVTTGGANYMLTAGHCGRPGGSFNNGDDTRYFGTGAYENAEHDLLLVGGSVAGRIYTGYGGGAPNQFYRNVNGWKWAFPGEQLCSSGSVTGEQCGYVVTNDFTHTYCDYDLYSHWECYNDLLVADLPDGQIASRHGDSGGPVFELSPTLDQTYAVGIISGLVHTNGLIFQDFGTAWRDFGVTPLTFSP